MNELTKIELIYETLVPVADPDKTFLSVGTVSLCSSYELNLDFNSTSTSFHKKEDSYVELYTTLADFEPRTFEDEYQKLGFSAKDLTYDFFASRLASTYVTEVYTEYLTRQPEVYLPVTLKSIQLHFADGSFLDYSDRISVFALAELAEVA